MEKFTKGPWFVSDGRPYLVIKGKVCANGDDGEPIVVADTNHYFSEARANATLIAAAPEMYEMLASIKQCLEWGYTSAELIDNMYEYTDKLGELLAKARGEHDN